MPRNTMQITFITHLGRPTKILTIRLSCIDQWNTITTAAIATYEMNELVDGSASKKSDLVYIELRATQTVIPTRISLVSKHC